jgi:hypothetical protein
VPQQNWLPSAKFWQMMGLVTGQAVGAEIDGVVGVMKLDKGSALEQRELGRFSTKL